MNSEVIGSETLNSTQSMQDLHLRAVNYLASKRLQLCFLAGDSVLADDDCRFCITAGSAGRWQVEGIVELSSWTFTATCRSSDPFQAIDKVTEDLQRQLLQNTGSYQRLLDCQTAVNASHRSQDYHVAI